MVQPFAGDSRGDARPVRHESRYYVNITLSGEAGETPTGNDDDDDGKKRAKESKETGDTGQKKSSRGIRSRDTSPG